MSEMQANEVSLLAEIFDSITRLAGVRVCMYDLKQHFGKSYRALHSRHGGHRSPFCTYVREYLGNGYEACLRSDTREAVMLATQYKRPFLHTCHAGLTDLVVPVLYNNDIIAVAFCGQCRLAGETRWETVLARLQPLQPDAETLRTHYESLPLLDRPTLSAAGRLLDISLRYLVEVGGRQLLRACADNNDGDPLTAAELFIREHYSEAITARTVAQAVHLNQAYLARLFRRKLGCTITELITKVRIERACQLLAHTAIPARSIAYNIGYRSYRHFVTAFCRLTGEKPGDYRLAWQAKRQVDRGYGA